MTVLTAVMILAVITITGVFVTRLPILSAPPALPPNLRLPEGDRAQAVTLGTGWIAVVTEDQRLLIFGEDGTLRQELQMETD